LDITEILVRIASQEEGIHMIKRGVVVFKHLEIVKTQLVEWKAKCVDVVPTNELYDNQEI